MKTIRNIFLLLLLVAVISAAYIYQTYINGANVPESLEATHIQIPSNSSFDEVVALLNEQGILKDEYSFRWFAEYMKYQKKPMRPGRFKIEPGWNNIQLIRHLRNGEQAPVNVVLSSGRVLEDVAGKAASFIEADSSSIMQILNNEDFQNKVKLNQEQLMSLFIPNTYQFFWNSSAEQFAEKMTKEHEKFWGQNNRLAKAKALGLTPAEVYTLASIVERETLVAKEKPLMAGVYLNRLNIGMRLQADPTAVFARKDFDTGRVTDYHTKFDSPYNTYMYSGLPPGPISMANISSIDAVLNRKDHKYLYFCAKGDGSGLHNFAKNLAAHNQNAATYRRNLRKRGLR